MAGPLEGVRVLELGGIGPTPFAGMLLADQGAEVIRIDRAGLAGHPVLNRSRRSVVIDLKDPRGLAVVRRLASVSDATLEGFRPGVAERLGIGPDDLLSVNPSLVYGRMTGWGQDGPLARAPGHDLNYIALSGALHAIGLPETPVVPLNLIGDFGGGGMLLAYGVLCALMRARRDGTGQVVDAAMVDGSALLMSMLYGYLGAGRWQDARGVNRLDGGAPWYRVYRTRDDRHVAVGCVEPQFYADLLDKLGLTDDPAFADQNDPVRWPVMHERLSSIFATRTRDDWGAAFEGTSACVTPVLSMREAPEHPHNVHRQTFEADADGVIHPMPAPRFDRTPAAKPAPAPTPGADTRDVLSALGLEAGELDALFAAGVLADEEVRWKG
jgi:alpha-methylacyl-CoA racemase